MSEADDAETEVIESKLNSAPSQFSVLSNKPNFVGDEHA